MLLCNRSGVPIVQQWSALSAHCSWSPDTLWCTTLSPMYYNVLQYTSEQCNAMKSWSNLNVHCTTYVALCFSSVQRAIQNSLNLSSCAVKKNAHCTQLHCSLDSPLQWSPLFTFREAQPSCPKKMESGIWWKSRPKSKIVSESESTSDCGFPRNVQDSLSAEKYSCWTELWEKYSCWTELCEKYSC